jgi:hypothetical protein
MLHWSRILAIPSCFLFQKVAGFTPQGRSHTTAGPNIWRYPSKPTWQCLDFLDASAQRVRKTFRGFAVKPDCVEVFLPGFFVEFGAHC